MFLSLCLVLFSFLVLNFSFLDRLRNPAPVVIMIWWFAVGCLSGCHSNDLSSVIIPLPDIWYWYLVPQHSIWSEYRQRLCFVILEVPGTVVPGTVVPGTWYGVCV